MKRLLIILVFLSSLIGFGQHKPVLIDSIHSKRLCVAYPGMNRFLTTKEAFEESEYVFTGEVVEIIRTEKMEPTDYGIDENGNTVPMDFEPTYDYWYIFKTNQVFKGKAGEEIKIYARKFCDIPPFFQLNKKYLIYAVKGELQEHPYVYCQGNSCHIRYADDDIKELKELIKE